MKIAHVVESMEVGGAETLVAQMCRLHRHQGHDTRVYALAELGALGRQMQSEGLVVQPNVARNLPEATRNFYRIFKEWQPDAVHLHNRRPTIFAAAAARMAGVPSIVSTRHGLVARPHKLASELKYAVAARFCDWIAAICDATANNLRGLHTIPARKIVRIYNGALPLRRVAKEDWPPKAEFTLIYAGRLAPVKNLTLLLTAFRIALASMPGLQLWMLGDGSEREMLERLAADLYIADNVTFWGQQLDIAPFFSAADAFIMSSSSEGLPMALLQAYSVGLPSIVTDVGGMAEAVRLEQAGITVALTDPAGMAAAIQRLAGSASERSQFSINAEAAFQTRFSAQIMADAYRNLYRNTARSGGRK